MTISKGDALQSLKPGAEWAWTGSVVYHVEMNNYASGSSSTLEAQRQDTTDSTSNITVLEIGA